MKFTLNWLEKFLDLQNTKLEVIVKALTDLGLEVESVSRPSPLLNQFIVGEIIECKKHPNANKLNLCSVNDGNNILNIVCGASNVRAGLKIVLAPIDSIIPANNMKIQRRKIRDIESQGMICSAEELGLGEKSDGILELDDSAKTGNKFIDECPWAKDILIDIAITPNRSDCLGVYGIARDLAAYGIGKLKTLKINKAAGSCSSPIKAIIDDIQACPLFVGRYFKDIDNSKQSPSWLKIALNSIGENSISPIVDITNYMSYSFGRPLHAFDADKVKGNLHARLAKEGEKLLTLKEDEIALEAQDIVIADESAPCAIAGIMGGDSTKCTSETKNIFLESAVFDPILIAKTGQRTKINSDAKYRFERGTDHDFTIDGIEIATAIIQEICGGAVSDLSIAGNIVSKTKYIDFDLNLVAKLSGTEIKHTDIKSILKRLGFKIEKDSGNIIKIIVPSWRNDIEIPEDLVEEVLRISGYENIPTIPIATKKAINATPIPHKDSLELQLRSMLAARGFDEMITWSFMSSKLAKEFRLLDKSPQLANPISEELNVMRAALLPNLLTCIHKNNARSFNDLSIFEIGNVFENKKFSQTKMLSAVRSGNISKQNIFKTSRTFDFFDLKSDALALLQNIFNIKSEEIHFAPSKDIPHWYNPAKSAIISINKKVIGYLGEIHPLTLKAIGINNTTLACEFFIQKIPYHKKEKHSGFSNYQIVSRDFAFILDKTVPAIEVTNSIKSIKNNKIKSVEIFDLFTAPSIGEDKKSIAIRVTLQATDHSLSEEEISNLSSQIINSVTKNTKGALREV